MNKSIYFLVLLMGISFEIFAQDGLRQLIVQQEKPFNIRSILISQDKVVDLPHTRPLFSIVLDSVFYQTMLNAEFRNDTLFFTITDSIGGYCFNDKTFLPGVKWVIRFTNTSRKSHSIENLVPFGEDFKGVYITAAGSKEWPGYLCRSRLYRPGYGPVGVVLPDNAWHMGFTDYQVNEVISFAAIARRGQRDKELTSVDRWAITLKPGGWAEYAMYADIHSGNWHQGLKMMFQERWLYDLKEFDNSLFNRYDLTWMRSSWIMLLQFAWDKKYYDYSLQKHTFYDNLFEYDSLTGGYDIFTLWPTWPRLGLDQRNQWDMYRDLPGGLDELRRQVDFTHKAGKKYFISYNPWDEGTRKEDHLSGMEALLRQTDADGVVLDTRGESSRELQAAADRVKPGIIMYSEGMAVPKDMPGIVSGRVHDALVMPPPLNLNKLIRPDFAIFRVLQLADDRLHRELAVSFFNGYGVEINTMRPGRPDWIEDEYAFLGRTTKILRENNSVFHNTSFLPLLPTFTDSIYVNGWASAGKIIFTIYSVNPKGNTGPLFEFVDPEGTRQTEDTIQQNHFVDLWNHEEIHPSIVDGKMIIPAKTEAFDRSWLNTRREGNTGCIAVLPRVLDVTIDGRMMNIRLRRSLGDRIVLTSGNPTYRSRQFTFSAADFKVDCFKLFPNHHEKLVVQLFLGSELIDEVVVKAAAGTPVLIGQPAITQRSAEVPKGMVEVPAGQFRYYTKRDPNTLDPFIAFPDYGDTTSIAMPRFFMDKYPVTNGDYYEFMRQASYMPKDTTNFLKHWVNGKPAKDDYNLPVINVSLDDARAYAAWAGKRLPSEKDWQYAAQGTDMRKYPWGNTMDSTRCNFNLNYPTSVSGYPQGASPFGVEDLVGNVWQMTNDVYDNGSYYYNIIRGGSYYHPKQSIWYVTGGPLPVDHPEMLLLISPGLDRNSTVGFRCVKDGE